MPTYEEFRATRKRVSADTSSYEFMGDLYFKDSSEFERELYDDLVAAYEQREAA